MSLKTCFVPTCPNTSQNSKKIFLSVPKNEERRKKWFSQINIDKFSLRLLYCCEDHFNLPDDAENWIYFKTIGQNIILKKNVVPHLHLTSPKVSSDSQVSSSSKKRKESTLQNFCPDKPSCSRVLFQEEVSTPKKLCDGPSIKSSSATSAEDIIYLHSPSGKFEVQISRFDKGIQANIRPHKRSVATMTQSDCISYTTYEKELSVTSESSSSSPKEINDSDSDFQVATSSSQSVASTVSPIKGAFIDPILIIERDPKFYCGLPPQTFYVVNLLCSKETKLTKLDVLLTLKKIRLNDQYKRLADEFKISVSKAGQIFRKSVPIIAGCLQQMIFWHSSEEIQMLLPEPFWFRYKKVESLIDCFEIEIQKPSHPVKQSHTWSEYKKCNTIKYLVSSTPHGYINFCSGGFGGRTSDKLLFENSGYLQILKNNTEVMADRGFKHIAAFLSAKNCKLIRPPSVSSSEKPTKAEVKESKRIAALRIHIERVIGRIREFEMLQTHVVIHNHLVSLLDNVVIIACGIINLQTTLFK